MNIGGCEAAITHTVSVGPEQQEEHFFNEKKAIFIKDDVLYEIWTNFTDNSIHQKVWDGFNFEI
jgi:hypothetical protein